MKPLLLAAALPLLAAPPAAEGRTVVFLGDSLTAGYGLAPSQAYPVLLEPRLKALGWKAVNAGVSGDTSSGALRRLDWTLKSKPRLVFVCIGANDGLRGVPPEATEANLRRMVEKIRAAGATPVLAGISIPENYGPEFRKRFEAIYPRVARELKVPLLPFLLEGVAMDPRLNQADGIHPNASGQQRVADHVWTFLRSYMK